jgi:hypothetical protein
MSPWPISVSAENIHMGKVTWKGWYTAQDEIPQPIGIIYGRNLRKELPLEQWLARYKTTRERQTQLAKLLGIELPFPVTWVLRAGSAKPSPKRK